MTSSVIDGVTTLNASDSDIPSIANSLQNLTSSKQSVISPPHSPDPEQFIAELLEKAKFYTSLCLGTTAILSVFAFLFLIPFVVDPAISVIVADYEQSAITCMVTDHVFGEGLRNCTWSSCREGCTTAATKCHQMLVNYTKISWEEWQMEPNRNMNLIQWDVADTKLLINSEGCGYPPRVNCTEFAKRYGFSRVGEAFPCYYSKAYPEMVITRYSWDDNLKHLILSIIIPCVLFATSISVLSYWYSPCCDRSCNKTTLVYADNYETKEENLLCRSDDEDDEELDF